MAVACLLSLLIDQLYHAFLNSVQFAHFDVGHFLIDFSLTFCAAIISLDANRLWPLFAAAAQLLALIGYTNAFLLIEGTQSAYWAVTQLPLYITVLAILMGTISHRKRLRQSLPVRDWRARLSFA